MILTNFDRFIGIDWAGAENPKSSIQVAQCSKGSEIPEIVLNHVQGNWRRKEVLNWLIKCHNNGERVLAGFDFAFAYPYCDRRAYFPGHKHTPKNVESLWKLVDSICNPEDFYGGPFYKPPPFCDYLLYQTYKGERYDARLRHTDKLCSGNPQPIFKCVGAESVGIGSIAGMRMLHHIKTHLNKEFQIWPFEKENNGRSMIVEIYPTLFFWLARQNSIKRSHETLNNALKFFNSEPLPSDPKIESKDKIDASISSAAIRHLANDPNTWHPAALNECARGFEGWIFGVQ
ncbi:MAG: hypothetical protein PHX53_17265 [Syntrophales bacterium]|nr:hypothetical protein [Syntrophales bacterium]